MSKSDAAAKIAKLRQEHEKVKAVLMKSLPTIFGVPVEDVESFEFGQTSQTGILVSGGTRYRYRIDGNAGVKELLPE